MAKNLWSILGSAFYLPLIWILGKKSQRLFLKHDLVLFARICPYVFLQIFCWWSARAVWNSLQQQLTKTKPRSALLPPAGTEGNPAFDLSIQQLLGRSARRLGDKDIDISFTYAGIQIWIFETAAGASFVPCSLLYLAHSPCSGACSWKAWGWILWVMSLSAALCVVHAEVSSNLSFRWWHWGMLGLPSNF